MPVTRVLIVTLVVAVLLGTVCAVSLCLSALLPRTTASGLLSYAAVALLTIGTLIAFGLATALTSERFDVPVRQPVCDSEEAYSQVTGLDDDLPPGCRLETSRYEASRSRTDRTWWLLAPNPFVILADASPALPDAFADGLTEEEARRRSQARDLDPLGQIGGATRDLRREPVPLEEYAALVSGQEPGPSSAEEQQQALEARPTGRVWPYGLAFDAGLAGVALALTVRSLRTPTRTLPRGQRVA